MVMISRSGREEMTADTREKTNWEEIIKTLVEEMFYSHSPCVEIMYNCKCNIINVTMSL